MTTTLKILKYYKEDLQAVNRDRDACGEYAKSILVRGVPPVIHKQLKSLALENDVTLEELMLLAIRVLMRDCILRVGEEQKVLEGMKNLGRE